MVDQFLDLATQVGATGNVLNVLDTTSFFLLLVGLPVFIVELSRLWRRRALRGRRLSGMLTSLFCFVPATLIDLLFAGALLALFAWVAALAPWAVPTNWATAVLCLLLVDLTYYWEHRLGHQVNVLWASYHSVHHSGDHFDQSIALRVSFVDFFVTPLFYLPLVLAGFDLWLVFVCLTVVLAWQQWLHTELVGRLPLFDPWLNTPSNHRVHHGRNPQYIDKNYGGVLMIWDRLFGSYAAEGEAVDYGLVEPLVSRNPIAVHFHGLAKLRRDLATKRSAGAVIRTMFSPPASPDTGFDHQLT